MTHVIRNLDALAENALREDALALAEAGYAAINVGDALARALRIEGEELVVSTGGAKTRRPLRGLRVFFVGIGKCALVAAGAAEQIFGDRLYGGIALDVANPSAITLKKIELALGTHPLPSEENVSATARIMRLLGSCGEGDLVIMLVSGGGSTLIAAPEAPMTVADERKLFELLTDAGATIEELNTVRKHTSLARGGGLAKAAFPAEVISLIVSDVPGNDIEFISSGPTVRDGTTVADARAVLARYAVPDSGLTLIETPKEGKYFDRVTNALLLSNDDALAAMREEAARRGYAARIVNDRVSGEAREVGRGLVELLHEAAPYSALLYAGETTVALGKTHGNGGRNQELALGALGEIRPGELLLALASDGRDNTDHAGAIADTLTKSHADSHGLDAREYVAQHRSYDFFTTTGDALETGYTGSNVSDIIITIKNDMNDPFILWFEDISMDNVAQVGGKNASLGELIRAVEPNGVRIPHGFAVTAAAYYHYLKETGLDTFIEKTLKGLDTSNLKELSRCGKIVREKMRSTALPKDLEQAILNAYAKMESQYGRETDVAVRSSATAEDLPGASFAGEQETYLNIRGGKEVVRASIWTMASLFTDRAISYRTDKGFDHMKVALSVGVQKMVRSDKGASGVMFTVDTESGFKDVVVVNATYGLGEMIVQGHVTPDEYLVSKSRIGIAKSPIIWKKLGRNTVKMIYDTGKRGVQQTRTVAVPETDSARFVLSEEEVVMLASWGRSVEEHYSERAKKWTPMDMEWAKDGLSGELFIVQARPETVQAGRDFSKLVEYSVSGQGKELVRGISVGSKVATGVAHVIKNPKQIREFKQGEVLVTTMTDPDWEPIMKMASAIVTDKGGRTSHAAIVSRELGLPAIVGSGNATKALKTGMTITVDTTGSDGIVTEGAAKISTREHSLGSLPETKTKIMVNIASPEIAFEDSFLPVSGVGLAREEFIINSQIGIHPLALLNLDKQPAKVRKAIEARIAGWSDPVEYYVDNLAYGIAKIGAAFAPRPVIVRFSDFKTNEYSTLLGGEAYEPDEENPMIGWRGASRYYDPKFKEAFALEVKAIRKVREELGLDNVIPMIPFCRTTREAEQVLGIMKEHGLVAKSLATQSEKTTPVYMMCEIPSNVILAEEFLDLVDGMSIGSNDLTQLTLGLDRDSGIVTHISNENDEAVRALVSQAIRKCKARGKYIGICGQGPSDLPDFAEFLVKEGIESMSLNPDSVVKTIEAIAQVEEKLAG